MAIRRLFVKQPPISRGIAAETGLSPTKGRQAASLQDTLPSSAARARKYVFHFVVVLYTAQWPMYTQSLPVIVSEVPPNPVVKSAGPLHLQA